MANNGNTFDANTFSIGHARKVFREVRQAYPGGASCSNISDWVGAGIIPAGTPVNFNASAKTFAALTNAQITDSDVSDKSTLGINGYLQEDIVIKDANTFGTGTIVYDGAIYEYMIDADVLAVLKSLTSTPMIVFVQ